VSGDGGKIDREISRRFWEKRGELAGDARATTLDTEPGWWVRYNVRLYQNFLLRHLASWNTPWGKVVDLGCGNGDWTVMLAERAREVVASDFSQSLLDSVRRRLDAKGAAHVTYVHGDAASFQFPAGCDLIVLGAVLQYLEDAECTAVIQRAASALSPQGVLYVRTTTTRKVDEKRNCTDAYQAIYRRPVFFEQRIRDAGLRIDAITTGTRVLADESMHRLVGRHLWPTLGRALAMPLRLARRVQRVTMDTEVHHWLARKPSRDLPSASQPAGEAVT
jgi:ubiquinone/menaquinone biosynthesis C-methylase UbiE